MKTTLAQRYDIHAGSLILVNADHPCRATPSPRALTLVDSDSGVRLVRRAAVLLERLMQSIHGWEEIAAVSGWRSSEEQQHIWAQSLAEHGEDFTRRYVAVPGYSEHQTGLAIDLGRRGPAIDFIRPAFPRTGVCEAFRRQAALYGFIERYPAGKEAVTGIAAEPWHFRYVGAPHAEEMARQGLVLEDYHACLREFPFAEKPLVHIADGRRIEIGYLPAEADGALLAELVRGAPYTVSGNNLDGLILTVWRDDP